eukprot:jgi/Ulvmu1/11781/UM008_0195.1
MSLPSLQRTVHRIGNVENWLHRTDLRDRRIRMINVKDQVVGRVAFVIANALQGKDRPDFTPQSDGGDVVVVVNADQAVFTGKKMQDKVYYRHMRKPGNLRQSSPEEKKEQYGGAELIWKAVSGMLPKNKLRKRRLGRMLVYNDGRHDFDEAHMFPLAPAPRRVRPSKLRWNLPDGFEPVNAAAYYRLWRGADPEWEAKLDEVTARRDAAAAALAAAGWTPPVQDNVADADAAVQKLMQGLRIQ